MEFLSIAFLVGIFLIFAALLVIGQGIDRVNKNLESIKSLIEYYGDEI